MDSYVLTGPQGSSFNIGTYLRGDQPQDYGSAGLLQSILAENSFVDGAVLNYEHSGPRRWTFSLLLATGAFGGLDDLGRLMRQIARPGAFLDVQTDGTASGNVVRWDVIAGRVEEAYDLAVHRAGRTKATLQLDTQPYGYLPTWILLASSGALPNPGTLTIPGGSIIGDVPGFMEIIIAPTTLNVFGTTVDPTYLGDSVLWSAAGRAGGFAFWPAASLISSLPTAGQATLISDIFSPGGTQALRAILTAGQQGWTGINYVSIPSGLEAQMRGRWRAFAFARSVSASNPYAALISADVISGNNTGAAMGSYGPIATLGTPRFAGPDGAVIPVPTGHVMLDLGEITIPPAGSGIDQDVRLRLWANASWPAGPATVGIDIGGIWLQDLDGPAGVLPRGLSVPTTQTPSVGRFVAQSYDRRLFVAQPTGGLSSYLPALDALALYRGQFPMAHPSQAKLDYYVGGHADYRRYTTEILADSPVAWYRLTETVGPTLIDSSANAQHGAYIGSPSLTASSLTLADAGVAGAAAFASGQFGIASSAGALVSGNGARTIEAWFQPATLPPGGNWIAGYGIPTSSRVMAVEISATRLHFETIAGNGEISYTFQAGQTYHVAMAYGGTFAAGYVNGAGIGTTTLSSTPSTAAQMMIIGALASGAQPAYGVVDEVAVYQSALGQDRILAHYLSGRALYGATSPPIHVPQQIAASVRYRPRFGFSRGV